MTNTNKTTIGFTGDFSFSAYFDNAQNRENLIDEKILDFLKDNDANVINFESPITDCRMTRKRRLAHRSSPKSIDFLKEKFKNPVLSLANNHMMDYSYVGLIDTIENLENSQIPFIGAGRNKQEASDYVIVGDEVKVGIFAIQYKDFRIAGTKYAGPLHDKRKETIAETIQELKEKVDYVVLVYHGGDEFLHAPMPYFRKHLRKYLDMGCDLVVSHHPHVVQGYEYFGKKCIFYSLGNFMFDTNYQRAQEDSDRGVIIKLAFTKEGFTFDKIFSRIDRTTNTVKITDNDAYFDNYNEINYSKLWALEAARQKDIKERARLLREKELAEMEEKNEEYKEYIQGLKEKYMLLEDIPEDQPENQPKPRSMRKQAVRLVRRGVRKLKSPKTYEGLVIKLGAGKAKILYRQ